MGPQSVAGEESEGIVKERLVGVGGEDDSDVIDECRSR